MLFAGPIVIQWYWIPIFIVVTFVLPALTVGVISEFILRARPSGPRTWAKRGRMWGVVAVTLVPLSLVFDVALPTLQDGREARATTRAFDFTPHEPRPLPALFTVQAVSGTPSPPRLERHYMIGSSAATAYEQRPRGRSWRGTAAARLRSSVPSASGAENCAHPGASRCTSPRFQSVPPSYSVRRARRHPRAADLRAAARGGRAGLLRLAAAGRQGRRRVHAGLIE